MCCIRRTYRCQQCSCSKVWIVFSPALKRCSVCATRKVKIKAKCPGLGVHAYTYTPSCTQAYTRAYAHLHTLTQPYECKFSQTHTYKQTNTQDAWQRYHTLSYIHTHTNKQTLRMPGNGITDFHTYTHTYKQTNTQDAWQ